MSAKPDDPPKRAFNQHKNNVPDFEESPLGRSEYVTALAHFYRAEMYRSMVWRTRLDTSTNWAIISTLAILTTSLNNPSYATESLLLGMFVNVVFLVIEARRFRFFDVWRARVRMMEENFYGGILRRDQTSIDKEWGRQVADDLLCPRFHLTRIQAFRARLMRNFRFIFALFLIAWIGHRIAPGAPDKFLSGLHVFPVWVPDVLVGILYLSLILIAIFTPKAPTPEESYWPHPDHPGEDISSLDV
ncbi:MAG: DUF2270 domain-containing protein [Gemmatimonadales bacterium]|nr:DUF2270 domain-containing protein [Gemmatimonadales bacterium]